MNHFETSDKRIDRYACEEVFERLDDYIDRELSPHDTVRVEEHLKICEWCAKTYEFQSGVLQSVKSKLQRVPAAPDLLARISSALSNSRTEESD